MKLIKYGMYALLIGFGIANGMQAGLRVALEEKASAPKVAFQKKEELCQPELKTFDFSWVEKHKNDKSAKWAFLIDIYEKHKATLHALNTKPQDLFIFEKVIKSGNIAQVLKQEIIENFKHHDIRCFLPWLSHGPVVTHMLHDYDKFLVDDMKKLSTYPESITYHDLGVEPENFRGIDIAYCLHSEEEVADYQEFASEAQNLLNALYEIRRIMRINPEYSSSLFYETMK